MVNSYLLLSSWRYMLRQRWQTGLSFLAIALGVAVVVAVDIANQSARKAFDLSLDSISGGISHQIVSNKGAMDEAVFVQLRRELGITPSAPKVRATLEINGQIFTLLGVDPLSELDFRRRRFAMSNSSVAPMLRQPNGVSMSAQTLQRLALNQGDTFQAVYEQQPITLRVAATLDTSQQALADSVIVADISVVQRLLGRTGQLDSIDLEVDAANLERLKQWLPEGLRLIDTQARNLGLSAMGKAFHTNLTAMSLLALLVGALLIYNTFNFAALQRQKMIGTYRALGVGRKQLLSVALCEVLALAIAASALGVWLGYLLSSQLVLLVARTVNDLFFTLSVTQFELSRLALLKGIGVGVGCSVLAALNPVLRASETTPVTLQRRSQTESKAYRHYQKAALLGFVLLLAAYGFSQLPKQSLSMGFTALAFVAVGFCMMVPWFMLLCCAALNRLIGKRLNLVNRMALRGIPAGLSRTGVAVAALSVAIATVVGVSIMINSFRYSVVQWLDYALLGDVYIIAPSNGKDAKPSYLPQAMLNDLSSIKVVDDAVPMTFFSVETEYGPIETIAASSKTRNLGPLLLESSDDIATRFDAGEGIVISEPLAFHRKLSVGDSITLFSEVGELSVPVLGVFRNYKSSVGMLQIPNSLRSVHWPSVAPNRLALRLATQTDVDPAAEQVRRVLQGYELPVQIILNRDIKQETLAIFDRTFAITEVLRLLVLVVAFTGLLGSLLALQLEKSREFATLRATGMSRQQVGSLLLRQSGLLGVITAVLAFPLGLILAERLIYVINRRSFGWSMDFVLPWQTLPTSIVMTVVAALLASLYPWYRLRQHAIAQQMREEH